MINLGEFSFNPDHIGSVAYHRKRWLEQPMRFPVPKANCFRVWMLRRKGYKIPWKVKTVYGGLFIKPYLEICYMGEPVYIAYRTDKEMLHDYEFLVESLDKHRSM